MTTGPAPTQTNVQLQELLAQLEVELRAQQLWSAVAPSNEALSSVMPFMYDTLKLPEWLQWVFVPRLRALLDANGQLPFQSNIHPLAEHEWAKGVEFETRELLLLLASIDRALNTCQLTPNQQPDQLH